MLFAKLGTPNALLFGDATAAIIAGFIAAVIVVLLLRRKKAAASRVERSETPSSLETKTAAPPSVSEAAQEEEAQDVSDGLATEPVAPAANLSDGLAKTRSEGFVARLSKLFAGEKVDEEILDKVEEVLLTSDIGVRTADRLLESLKRELSKSELSNAELVWQTLKNEATAILESAQNAANPASTPAQGPRVTMVLGVNGTGKTTSIGKMANRLTDEGARVNLIAGDTFRAAAAEQLEVWGKRIGAEVFRGAEGADPSSVVYDGVRAALDNEATVVFVDTAGRLHTQVNLMEELRKVRRVMGKAIDGAPHEVLMVLDATTGQNAIQQARIFNEATDVTGIILTKLDGTAKGGIVIGIAAELGIPIRYVGVGERVQDLRDFDAGEFVDALFAS